jgi:chromosome segregation ATPase
MQKLPRLAATNLALATLIAVGLGSGCKASRIDQCNRLIEKINALDLSPPKGEDLGAIGQLATKAEQGAAALDSVALKDPQLVTYRQQYQKNLRAFGTVNRAVAATMAEVKKLEGSADPSAKLNELEKKLDHERAEIDKHARESEKLTGEINGYCSGS